MDKREYGTRNRRVISPLLKRAFFVPSSSHQTGELSNLKNEIFQR
ncbi:hypothetical protein BAME_12590 [Bacillus sp. M 2-6]|nr:hypothetical protein BAME_12590 [Bacillus sp. M 2-6]